MRLHQLVEFYPFFCKDEFIMHGEIWMSQICHAHNCRAVQKNETHPKSHMLARRGSPFSRPSFTAVRSEIVLVTQSISRA